MYRPGSIVSGLLLLALGLQLPAESREEPWFSNNPPTQVAVVSNQMSWKTVLGRVPVPRGWQASPCGPLSLCVRAQGKPIGSVEINAYPVKGSELEGLLAQAGDSPNSQQIVQALKIWVERHYQTIQADRQRGLGPSMRFQPQVPRVVAVGKLRGWRYGFTTRSQSRPQLFERSLGYVASDGKWLYVITTSVPASDAGGSFQSDAVLKQFEPYLDVIVAELRLPR